MKGFYKARMTKPENYDHAKKIRVIRGKNIGFDVTT